MSIQYMEERVKLNFNFTILLKTLREKEKMLVTSIFSYSHNFFYPV